MHLTFVLVSKECFSAAIPACNDSYCFATQVCRIIGLSC